jgi:hypothetical protein
MRASQAYLMALPFVLNAPMDRSVVRMDDITPNGTPCKKFRVRKDFTQDDRRKRTKHKKAVKKMKRR